MEDMFSLGNVGLWKYVTNSSWAPTGEVGERLFYFDNFNELKETIENNK